MRFRRRQHVWSYRSRLSWHSNVAISAKARSTTFIINSFETASVCDLDVSGP
jgi:hypothetical protein